MAVKSKKTGKPEKTEKKLPGLRISKAAKQAGVSTQTIEYYILVGLIRPIRGKDGRSRFFDDKLIRRIKLIKELNSTGYTLLDIKELYLKGK